MIMAQGKRLAAVLCTSFLLFAASFGCGQSPDEPRYVKDINAYLTNEMSDIPVLEPMDSTILAYMGKWGLHGMSLSIMRSDSLLYAKGYGESDEGKSMSPGTLLRIASVSKLLTATGIMVLQERGMLSLDDSLFTNTGLLSEYSPYIKDKRIKKITLRHLLMHESGFTSRMGDPMFSTLKLMKDNGWSTPPDAETLVRTVLGKPLQFSPGTASEYSNFGYLLLSMAIEKATGKPYEAWMQENVLVPAGCIDMHIASNYYEDRHERESRYWVHSWDTDVERFDGSGTMVPRCYGGSDITSLQGAGAWISSASELARLVAAIDARGSMKDIISPESVEEMTFTTDSLTYALGWNDISEEGVWTRTGTLSGTSALIKYYPDGECWVFISNTGTRRGPRFTKITSNLADTLRERYSLSLPARNLFLEPEGDEGEE